MHNIEKLLDKAHKDGSYSVMSSYETRIKEYHIYIGKDRIGPLSKNDLIIKLKNNEINSETFIWKNGMKDWQKISGFNEFSSYLIPPPPPNL